MSNWLLGYWVIGAYLGQLEIRLIRSILHRSIFNNHAIYAYYQLPGFFQGPWPQSA